MVHQYEQETGRKSTLPATTVAKLEKKLALQELGEVERLIRNGAGPGSIITQRGAREAINHLREQLGKPAAAVAVASTPTASAPSAARRSQAPAKPAATSKGRTARDFLALDAAATKQIIFTGCNITRGENIRHEIRSLFEGMGAGPDRTAFYQKFRSILTFR
jgi:hypothetical protein